MEVLSERQTDLALGSRSLSPRNRQIQTGAFSTNSRKNWPLIFLPLCASRHKHSRSSLWVTERGRVIFPCKDWRSAPDSGACGLDHGLSPRLRLPPRDRRRSPVADERRGHSNERAGQTVIAISNRWFSRNFSLSLTAYSLVDVRNGNDNRNDYRLPDQFRCGVGLQPRRRQER